MDKPHASLLPSRMCSWP